MPNFVGLWSPREIFMVSSETAHSSMCSTHQCQHLRQHRVLEFSCSCAFLAFPFPTSKKPLPCFSGVGTIRNWKALSKGNFSVYQILSFIQGHLTQFNYGLSKAFSTVEWSGKTDYKMQLTRELMNSWLSLWCVQGQGEAHWRRGKMKRSGLQQWVKMCNSGEETVWLLAWKSSSAAACWGKREWCESHRGLFWAGRIPSLHLTVFEGELRASGHLWKLQWDCFKFAGSLI